MNWISKDLKTTVKANTKSEARALMKKLLELKRLPVKTKLEKVKE